MNVTSKFMVGKYTCEMSWSTSGGLKCEWSPHVPPAKSFSKKEMLEYRTGRDALIQEIASTIGGNVMVVE